MNISSAFPLHCATAALSVRHDDVSSRTTVCVYKASMEAYDGVVALKDGSDRVLCWKRTGQIWMGTIDVVNPAGGIVLRVAEEPFMDLTSRVRVLALAGVAVHPAGMLFVSYYTTNIDGARFLVVDNLTASSSWSEGHQEVTLTRVFSMALPSGFVAGDDYGGEILFRPNNADPFLYIVCGPVHTDGLVQAQILRLSVDTPSATQVYASISGVPRRCLFDADRPQDLFCAIVEEEKEVVYLISDTAAPATSATPPSPTLVVAHQRSTTSPIVGGQLYRGYADDTLTGSYICMYESKFWASPSPSYSTAREIRVACSATTITSPPCGGDFTATVTSFGEDANKNALLLTTQGVYIVVGPTLCDDPPPPKAGPASTWDKIKWIIGVILAILAVGGGCAITVHCCNKNSNHEGDAVVEIGNLTCNVSIENNYYGENP